MQQLSALDLKIHSFLRQTGYPVAAGTTSSIQLLRYAEQELGCDLLGFLEQEYWDEQVTLDLETGLFGTVRSQLDDGDREAFDEVIGSVLRAHRP